MVLNLCLPHFNTTIHCNKLCADGYDVTNLVSAEPAVRRRGFKLEYFLRPPVQVTLKFGFRVELCRLDVELWPWGMDQGRACKRLEISTSSDQAREQEGFPKNEGLKVQRRDPRDGTRQAGSRTLLPGQQRSLQARQRAGEAPPEGGASARHSRTDPASSEPGFKLVGRCDLREDTRVSFSNPSFSPRPPFPSPPPRPAPCRQEELWSRGLPSLGAVTQLRVTVPFGGAASALGFKALAVWGQPARCCGAEQLDAIKRIQESWERRPPSPGPPAPAVSRRKAPVSAVTPPSADPVPEEFLDPITQEVMVLPMLLPSGTSVDNSTLEEHQKREATWGRAPGDPFTGVPFTPTSRPVPNPQLKRRIDHFLLKNGVTGTNGRLGRGEGGEEAQTSRLVAPRTHQSSSEPSGQSPTPSERSSDAADALTEEHPAGEASKCEPLLGRGNKRHLNGDAEMAAVNQPLQPAKRQRGDALPGGGGNGGGSHEERLSASLDAALLSVLCGRPSFTSNPALRRQLEPACEPAPGPQTRHGGSAGTAGGRTCAACSCSVSVYSQAAPPVYRLACGHLLCRLCLPTTGQRRDAAGPSASRLVQCPACRSSTPRSGVVRVHR